MTYSELIDRVKVKMEEYTPFAEEAAIAAPQSMGFEVKPIVSYIEQTIDEAANEMLMTLPLSLIRSNRMLVIDHIKHPDGTGIVGLGETFLRVHSFKMKDWQHALHSAVAEDSPLAELQENPYTMGGTHKPVLVYHRRLDVMPNNKALCYYSCKPNSDHEIEVAWQVSRFDRENIQDDLAEFFVTNCAKKVYGIFGMSDKVQLMAGELTSIITNHVGVQQ